MGLCKISSKFTHRHFLTRAPRTERIWINTQKPYSAICRTVLYLTYSLQSQQLQSIPVLHLAKCLSTSTFNILWAAKRPLTKAFLCSRSLEAVWSTFECVIYLLVPYTDVLVMPVNPTYTKRCYVASFGTHALQLLYAFNIEHTAWSKWCAMITVE